MLVVVRTTGTVLTHRIATSVAFQATFLEGQRAGHLAVGALDLEESFLLSVACQLAWPLGRVK